MFDNANIQIIFQNTKLLTVYFCGVYVMRSVFLLRDILKGKYASLPGPLSGMFNSGFKRSLQNVTLQSLHEAILSSYDSILLQGCSLS